jgi:hypothetical protein
MAFRAGALPVATTDRRAECVGTVAIPNLDRLVAMAVNLQRSPRPGPDLGRVYNVKHLRGMYPAAQALAAGPGSVLYGVPALVVLFRAPRYISEAQAAIGLERPVTRHIAWLAPIWPVLCVLLQRELNRLWQAQGVQVDERTVPIPMRRG